VFEKWRHIRVPHHRMLKNLFFSILLATEPLRPQPFPRSPS
jgi:hypothetical protein